MRRYWALGVIILALALAACGKDKKDNKPQATPGPDAESTQEVDPGYEIGVFQPGLKVRNGMTLLSHNEGVINGTGFFYGEVRNDSASYFGQVDAQVYLLTAEGTKIDEISVGPALTDIPVGQVFFVGGQFTAPEKFVDSQRWVWYDPIDKPSLTAYFGLPYTIEFQAKTEGVPFLVRGTVTNNTPKTLLFPVIDVMLVSGDGKPVGLTHAVLHVSAFDGTWPAGETAPFEAAFGFVAVDAAQVTQIKVSAVGYTMLDQ
jgi:hypothetical protein